MNHNEITYELTLAFLQYLDTIRVNCKKKTQLTKQEYITVGCVRPLQWPSRSVCPWGWGSPGEGVCSAGVHRGGVYPGRCASGSVQNS